MPSVYSSTTARNRSFETRRVQSNGQSLITALPKVLADRLAPVDPNNKEELESWKKKKRFLRHHHCKPGYQIEIKTCGPIHQRKRILQATRKAIAKQRVVDNKIDEPDNRNCLIDSMIRKSECGRGTEASRDYIKLQREENPTVLILS